MRRFLAIAFAVALLSPAAAKQWAVDPASSRLGFEVQAGGMTVAGTFLAWDATISFDPNDLAHARASVSIDLTRVETGDAKRDGQVTGPNWLNATSGQGFGATDPSNPGIGRFESSAFRHTGGNAYEADGTLTLRGTAQAITLPFTLEIDGDSAHMTARVAIDRTRWGVGQSSDVATNVDVVIDLTAKAAP
jgi:polyisoprenoid-binding protein YceI